MSAAPSDRSSPAGRPAGRWAVLGRLLAATSGYSRTVAGRVTARRALLAGVVATALLISLVVVAAVPPPDEPFSEWLGTGRQETVAPPSPPPYQPVRSLAAPAETSPPPGSPDLEGPAPGPGSRQGPGAEFANWSIMDTTTGAITGSSNLAATSTTASMIKAWLAADYLRRAWEQGQEPPQSRLDELTLIVRDSNNEHTQELFVELGHHQSIERLISICGLTDSYPVPLKWSNTQLSARDTARMGACIARGDAAGPDWTDWLLDEMRSVRGLGDFGIRHALPAAERSGVAIKNGWVIRSAEGEYHVNCLAIGDGWTMGVLTRYPAEWGYQHGAEICRSLAADHLT